MFGGITQAGTKTLGGDRFTLVNLMPAVILVGFVSFLAATGLYTDAPADIRGLPEAVTRNAGVAVIAVFGVFVLAFLLRPFQVALVWVLEGYWNRWPSLDELTAWAVEWHRRRLHTATVEYEADTTVPSPEPLFRNVVDAERMRRKAKVRRAHALRVVSQYPVERVRYGRDGEAESDDRLMPTMLGNVLREGEDTAGDRYGLDLPAIAPRLHPYINEKLGASITRNLDLIEAGAALCVAFALAALASTPLLARPDAWLVTPLIMMLLSLVSYRGTLRIARGHGRLLATAVDLHRFDMVAALRYELPTSPHEEARFNRALSTFLAGREPVTAATMRRYPYHHSDGPAPAQQPQPQPASSAGDSAAESGG